MIAQKEDRDCGLVGMSNLLDEVLGQYDCEAAYNMIRREYNYPTGDNLRCDLWDSPPRHFKIMEKMTGQKMQLVKHPERLPSVVLLCKGVTQWHWVTSLGMNRWHDGYRVRESPLPLDLVVLAYAPDGDGGDLPWYWSVWYWLTFWS